MSPDIRRVWPEVPTTKAQMFVINLAYGQPFDPEAFAAEIDQLPLDPNMGKIFKWIVRGDDMIIFPNSQRHSVVNYAIEQNGYTGELSAAGSLLYSEFSGWTIYGESRTLDRILPVKDSNAYKQGPLREKLGDFFKFSPDLT